MSRCFLFVVLSAALTASTAFAQTSMMLPKDSVTKVSDHVWAIMGFPNVAIVLGANATLVVDTGLGPRNGEIVMRQVEKLSKTPKLFLTTTHFHPEHAGGEQAFPTHTIIIRNAAQQEELDHDGASLLELFRNISAESKGLLVGVKFRPPDVVFDNESKLDLGGGVTARLMWLGGGHTRGDELIFVEPDSTLISGDIVQKNTVPGIFRDSASVKRWIASLDKLTPLKPRYVVPDHGELGDGSLITQQKAFLVDVQTRALDLKRQGKSADQATPVIVSEIKAKYPAFNITPNNMGNVVKRVYEEN